MTGSAKPLVFLLVCVLVPGSLVRRACALDDSTPGSYRVQAATVPLVINELMAANGGIFRDPQGQSDDWIEIYNAGSQVIDMAGMYLTDDLSVPRKWKVPTNAPQLTKVSAKGYLIVWLDGNTADPGLHASFALDSLGDQIALFDTDGTTLIDAISFEGQRGNISYGRYPNGANAWFFLSVPTPGAANAAAFLDVVADTKFSRDREFYDAPFDVTITCATPGATVLYTLDGSDPVPVSGRAGTGSVYSGPIRIAKTTCLRARAIKTGWLSSNADTQTYVFLSDAITRTQAEVLARGYPDKWFGSYAADYEMDPQVCTDPAYAGLMKDAMLAIPTLSLVTDKDNFFSQTNNAQTGGIYIYTGHSSTGGRGWERPVSVELFASDGAPQLQVDCGIRIQGGEGRNPQKCPKHCFGLRFRSGYGPSRLEFPLFDGGPVTAFDALELRGFFNNAWTHWDPGQRQRTQYIRDQWMHDALVDMGNPDGGRGLYVHLYINGIYWGLYVVQERPSASHYAAYHGGDQDRIDAINGGRATDGTVQAWNEAKSIAASKDWARIQQVIDIDNFIDWALLGYFAGNQDLKTDGNWRAAGGGPDRRPWRLYSWDGERVLEDVNQNGIGPAPDPTGLYNSLVNIEEFRIRFGDRVHKHLFNGGALTPERNAARWTSRADEIDLAVIAESARWGDYRRDVHPYSSGPYLLYTRNAHWVPERNRLLNDYFPRRTNIALSQFKSRGLYPNTVAPVFYVDGKYQHGGHSASNSTLSMQGATGTIWYTLDGTDPRSPGAAAAPASDIMLVAEDAAKRVLVPTGAINNAWRGGQSFDDSTWISGTGGVGYERSTGYEKLFQINVQTQMYGRNPTCCVRIGFNVSAADLGSFSGLTLRAHCDDGFVAYLNGSEIARKNFVGEPAWNSVASASTADADAILLSSFDAAASLGKLRQGQNILALHALNDSATSSDFLISVELTASKTPSGPSQAAVAPTVLRYTVPITLTQSCCVKARALSGSTWSALNEAVYAVGPVAESLRVSEIMYHPLDTGNPNDPNTEYIELTNVGSQSVNLSMVRFTKGIDYTFPGFDLPSGGYCLVVKDTVAFSAKYGSKLPVVGQYAGNLNNGGERVELVDAAGQTIQGFVYDDDWFDTTDGSGFSLTVKDPKTSDAGSLNDKNAWRPSGSIGGSPGVADPQ
jgi:hypothetical protein